MRVDSADASGQLTYVATTMGRPPEKPERKKYLYGVQGLRTVAALMVAVYHIWFHRVSGGVDIFFVVAGFFAAGSLADMATLDAGNQRWKKLRDYVLRTMRRVVPSAVIVILFTVLGTVLWLPQSSWRTEIKHALASSLFVENFQLILAKTDYVRADELASPFQQFWALSIQVQSYVFFALVVFLAVGAAFRIRKRPALVLRWTIVTLFAVSFIFSILSTASSQKIAYFNFPSRFWEFLAGAILAGVVAKATMSRPAARILGWLGLLTMLSFAAVIDPSRLLPGFIALVPIGSAAAIIVASRKGVEPSVLTLKPILWFADSSFAFYLWHWPLLIFYRAQISDDVGVLAGVVMLVVSAVLAVLTTKFVEQPFRNWKLLASSSVASLVAMVLFLSLAWGAIFWWSADLKGQQAVARQDLAYFRQTGTLPEGVDFVPSPLIIHEDTTEANKNGCAARTKDTELFSCEWGDPAASKTVALVGASHDTQWLTVVKEVADLEGAQTVSYLKNACPFGDVTQVSRDVVRGCEGWSEALMEELLTNPPDVVVTIGTTRESGSEEIPEWKRTYFDKLLSAGISVVAIRDNPSLPMSGPQCVEQKGPEKCFAIMGEQFADVGELEIPINDNFHFVDLLPEYCEGNSCNVIRGQVLMYTDSSHLSETWTLQNGEKLADAIALALREE